VEGLYVADAMIDAEHNIGYPNCLRVL